MMLISGDDRPAVGLALSTRIALTKWANRREFNELRQSTKHGRFRESDSRLPRLDRLHCIMIDDIESIRRKSGKAGLEAGGFVKAAWESAIQARELLNSAGSPPSPPGATELSGLGRETDTRSPMIHIRDGRLGRSVFA